MQLLYVGFEQAKNVREYVFHGIAHGEEPHVFVVSAEMALFQSFHVGLQEGPMMCLRTLTADLEALDPANPVGAVHRCRPKGVDPGADGGNDTHACHDYMHKSSVLNLLACHASLVTVD